MPGPWRNPPPQSSKPKREDPWIAVSMKAGNLLPGLVLGFIIGWFLNSSNARRKTLKGSSSSSLGKQSRWAGSVNGGEELKMVLVVRQDLRMGPGKIASQCAHAATGLYAELLSSNRHLLRQWEHFGQAKIVVTCKNRQEMNRLRDIAESIGLPTFVVEDAGRTEVIAGSKTVLAIGPGRKTTVDSVTGKLRLL